MLGIGILGFASSSLIAGATNSLILFAAMRFTFGLFSAAINAPMYQLISANFPLKYRTTANAVEASGYHLGAGVASFMALIIRSSGWRAMYRCMGSFAFTIGVLIMLFVKNPKIEKKAEVDTEPTGSDDFTVSDKNLKQRSILGRFKDTIVEIM